MNKTFERILLVLGCLTLCMALGLFFVESYAEEDEYELRCWVLCQPDSYVNIREFAKKGANATGYMECGDAAYTDGKTKRGYLYLCGAPTEAGSGWIHKGYVVYTEPVIITFGTNIYSKGRVACWRSIGGTRRCWANEGDVITVYAVSEEWCVTNKGFIKTKYLGVDYDLLLANMEGTKGNSESTDLYWEDDEGQPQSPAI